MSNLKTLDELLTALRTELIAEEQVFKDDSSVKSHMFFDFALMNPVETPFTFYEQGNIDKSILRFLSYILISKSKYISFK
jgi:hypothetical protein